ncbi:MAG: U32 family peptidase [Elusimicrobiota bacterium]
MKIISCIIHPDEINLVKEAGADEIYFAYSQVLNFGEAMSIQKLRDVQRSIEIAHKNKLKIYLAANGFASKKQSITVKGMIKDIKKIINCGIDGLIVSNLGVFEAIKKYGIKTDLHLSSVNPVFNSYTLDFFYRKYGISRVILPNQLSAIEAEGIMEYAKKNMIKTEIFYFKFFGCPYINGFCYMHSNNLCTRNISSEYGLCVLGRGKNNADISPFNIVIAPPKNILERVSMRISMGGSPRILNISSFFDYCLKGVDFIKYGTRTDDTKTRVYKVSLIKRAINAFKELTSKYSVEEAKERFIREFK